MNLVVIGNYVIESELNFGTSTVRIVNFMTASWRLKLAVSSIRAGDVIACPAESVWGLSCSPWRLSAVQMLCHMKQRALSKGVIVASHCVEHFSPLLDALPVEHRQEIMSSWPGPFTWLVPNHGFFPPGSLDKAVRLPSA